jgi:hypothetical protein
MVAGVVLIALGNKRTTGHVDEPLKTVPALALFAGIALYHGAHVAFRLRIFGDLNVRRLLAAVLAVALIPLADEVDALVALGAAAAIAAAVIAFEFALSPAGGSSARAGAR